MNCLDVIELLYWPMNPNKALRRKVPFTELPDWPHIERHAQQCKYCRAMLGLKSHDFTLVIGGISELTEEIFDALFEAGCDDGTPFSRDGRVFVTFTRPAATIQGAIRSAVEDVRKANVGTYTLRVA